MPRLKCPRCATVIDVPPGTSPQCPNCGFGASAPVAPVPPPAPASPTGWDSPAAAQPAFSPPGAFGAPPAAQRTSGKAIAALVLGIASMCIPYVGIVTGIIAIIMGVLGMKEVDRSNGAVKGKGMAITGLVLGAIALVLYLIVILFFGALLMSFDWECLDNPDQPGCEEYQDGNAAVPEPPSPLTPLARPAAAQAAYAPAWGHARAWAP